MTSRTLKTGIEDLGAPTSALFLPAHLFHPYLSRDSHCFALMSESMAARNAKASCFTTKKGWAPFLSSNSHSGPGAQPKPNDSALQDGILCVRKVLPPNPSIHAGKGRDYTGLAWRILWWPHGCRGNKLSPEEQGGKDNPMKNGQSLPTRSFQSHDLCTDNDTVVTGTQLENYIRWL